MRKKTIPILLSFALFLNPLLSQETENATAKLLREALFAEQADRDLATAEKGYREIIKKFETDRAYAATAILRLAEILHQRGDTAEAEKWFVRVLQEFPDQEAIAKVAKNRLGDKAPALIGAKPARINPQTEVIERLAEILKQSPDLLDTPIKGNNFLADASAKGQLEVIEFLLSKGALVNVSGNAPSALGAAVEYGHLTIVARLLKAGAKLEPDLLITAVRSGNYAISELLLKAGANPNTIGTFRLTPQEIKDSSSFPPSAKANESDDPFGGDHGPNRKPENVYDANPEVLWTPLEIATFYRFAKLTDLLLANGAKSQKEKDQYSEDLRFAIIDQNSKLVAKLLKNGAHPNSHWLQPNERLNALSIASSLGNAGIVKQLIDAGADVNSVEANRNKTSLYYANGPTVAVLLAAGADPKAKTRDGDTPLHHTQDPAKAKALLAAGADPNARNNYGYSPIAYARPEVLDVLLTTKPDLTRFEGPHTALGLVSGEHLNPSQLERIRKLIAAGADPNQVDKNAMTPLVIAVSSRNPDSVKALIAGGANPNGVPNSPAPLTTLPAPKAKRSYSYGPVVRALVEAGADPNVLDSNKETVLRKLAKRNDIETVRFLLGKGAALQLAGKFAFNEAPDKSTTKAELFLATYLQPDRRRGIIRIVTPELGIIYQEVSAFVPADEKLPECPHSILEAYVNGQKNAYSYGEVTIWREGEAEPLKVNLRKIIASGDPSQDLKLAWGDLIQFSIATSEVEVAVSEAEKKFLNSHLKRQVKFDFGSGVKEVELGLDWGKLPHSENWRIVIPKNKTFLRDDTKNLTLIPLRSIGVGSDDPFNGTAPPKGYTVDRNQGRKLEIPRDHSSTLWLEPGDTVEFVTK